jgi:hypothetical protein
MNCPILDHFKEKRKKLGAVFSRNKLHVYLSIPKSGEISKLVKSSETVGTAILIYLHLRAEKNDNY